MYRNDFIMSLLRFLFYTLSFYQAVSINFFEIILWTKVILKTFETLPL